MLFLISPAKALDYDTPAHVDVHSQPLFVKQAAELIEVLRQKSPQEIAELMSLSDKLAGLNVARYAAWRPRFTASNSKQSVLAFDGDVYGGLDARSLSGDDLEWLQEHLCILSGLYGVLRPLDRMQPYRLEMGTRLETGKGRNLYQFWGTQIADYLNKRAKSARTDVVVNLASEEYFKSVDLKALRPTVVTCAFEERKPQGSGDGYRVVSIMAKRARGLMARFAVQHRVTQVEQLKAFDLEGYRFASAASDGSRLVFRRDR